MPPTFEFARTCVLCVLIGGAVVPAVEHRAAAQTATLDDLLRRMHGAVVEHEDELAGIASVEDYEQRVVDRHGAVQQRQVLRSNVLVFQLPPEESWFACRDVFEVNGEPVAGHGERLQHALSLDAPAIELAYKIYEESARYNIGSVVRTFNVPTFALAIFRPANRRHLRFRKIGEETAQDVSTWVIAFEERGEARFVATPAGKGLRVHGRVWVSPADGRIVRTELAVGGDRRVREQALVTVTFRLDPTVGIWVPDVMEERYEGPRGRGGESITLGRAVYSQPRRLEVKGRLRVQPLPAR
jgi:hypothetical protein